ncbi:60S ribosomal protein L28 [Geodia barretti]|uniref:Large ribosomal subunit protein eL28 n=1 Tax=Geodia barretti TaxID=519541 RepID=A0AA35X4R2_GEOBA|nr:60S ribosomal protein L28 [Geodia barretti]
MTTHSPDLQWLLIKNTSSFLVRRKYAKANTFTTEPNNLTGINAWKYNGLVNKKAVGITAGPDNKGIVLRTRRKRGGTRRPAKMFSDVVMVGDRRRTFRAIRKNLGGNCYRRDLVEVR